MANPHPIDYGAGDERSSSIWAWIAILLAIAAYPAALFTIHTTLRSSAADSAIWFGFGAMVLLSVAAMIMASIALIIDSGPMAVTMLALVIGAGTMVWAGVLLVSGLVGRGGWAMLQ